MCDPTGKWSMAYVRQVLADVDWLKRNERSLIEALLELAGESAPEGLLAALLQALGSASALRELYENAAAELVELKDELASIEGMLDSETEENADLRKKVGVLETTIEALKREVENVKRNRD